MSNTEHGIYGTLQGYAKKKKLMASSAYLITYTNAYSSQLVQECIHLQRQNSYFFVTKGILCLKFSHRKMQYFLWVESPWFDLPGLAASAKILPVHGLDL